MTVEQTKTTITLTPVPHSMSRIAVTGAGGRVGEHVLPELDENHEVTPVNRSEVTDWETIIADITDYKALLNAFEGFDVVVHLAAQSASESNWSDVSEPNIDGTWNVYQAAAENEVDRIVFASSNHVTHMYNMSDSAEPRSQRSAEESRAITTQDDPRPSGPYGITKVAGEAIGTYFADRYDLDVVNARIGWVLTPSDLQQKQETDLATYARAMWLSPTDCRDGMRKAVEQPLPENPLTVNLLSENQERNMSLTQTMRALNYRPEDDSSDVVGG